MLTQIHHLITPPHTYFYKCDPDNTAETVSCFQIRYFSFSYSQVIFLSAPLHPPQKYEKELDRRSNREIPFCELPKIVVNSFPVFDDYELDVTIFDVYGMEARVSGNELCKALQQLPERKRNNLLMFYFLDMSDTEIAELQHISRAGVFKNRQVALHNMKKILQEEK